MPDARGWNQELIATNGVALRTIVEGDAEGKAPLLVLLHGFPRCWYLWRHQLAPLKEAGFRVAVPDQRGYGRSSRPERVDAYHLLELTADLVGLADALGAEKFHLVGHDWGCIVAWYTALLYPHRLHSVTGLSVPFLPLGPRAVNPPGLDEVFWYIRYFQQPGVAERELEADLDRTFRFFNGATFGSPPPAPRPRDSVMFSGEPPPLAPSISEEDHVYYVDTFRESGFRGPLSWYRNMSSVPTRMPWLEGAKIRVPAYFLAGSADPVLRFSEDSYNAQDKNFADLRGKQLLEGAGHWVQEEMPEQVTEALLGFLVAMQKEVTA